MKRKTQFQDFIQIQRLRNGASNDQGKIQSFFFHLVVGPLTFPQASYHFGSGSLRLGKHPKLKGSYVSTVTAIIDAAILKQLRAAKAIKENDNA